MTGTTSTLASLLGSLGGLGQVQDRTGLTGTYRFSLDSSVIEGRLSASLPSTGDSLLPNVSSGGSIASAVQDLGLKLERRKEPVDVLVIEQRFPTGRGLMTPLVSLRKPSVLFLLCLLMAPALRAADEHSGRVTLGGVPVPGARVIASQGEQRVIVSTGPDGTYRLTMPAEGMWTIRVEMIGFSPLTREVAIGGGNGKPEAWELTILPFAEITRACHRRRRHLQRLRPPRSDPPDLTGVDVGGAWSTPCIGGAWQRDRRLPARWRDRDAVGYAAGRRGPAGTAAHSRGLCR